MGEKGGASAWLPSGGCSIGWGRRCNESKGKKCRCACRGANHGRQIKMSFEQIDNILDKTNPNAQIALMPNISVDLAAPGSKDMMLTADVNVAAKKLNSASINMEYQFPGVAGFLSQCNLHVLVQPGCQPIAVMTEIPENPGTSVTNAVERIATKIYWEFLSGNCRPKDVRFIEHYPGFTSKEETWDLVTLQWNDVKKEYFGPSWRRIRKEEVYEARVISPDPGPVALPNLQD